MKKIIKVYTDGSVKNNTASVGIHIKEQTPEGYTLNTKNYHLTLSEPEKSSNRAELWGIIFALRMAHKLYPKDNIRIFSDSSYAINVPLKSRKPRANKDLIAIVRKLSEGINVEFKWIPRHLNEVADELSKQ